MKRLAKKLLNNYGFDIVRLRTNEKIYDLTSTVFNPYALLYRTTNIDSVLYDLPLADARDPFFQLYSKPSGHPYIQAVEQALKSSNMKTSIGNVLRSFYNQMQPANAAEFLGIEQFNNATLSNLKPSEFVWPWEATTISQKARNTGAQRRPVNGSKYGYRDLNRNHGWKHAGPVTEELILNECRRISALLIIIRDTGYSRHDRKDGDVVASILEHRSGRSRWSISSGMHRAAIASALGYSKIPVRIRGIIRQSDVSVWPNVMNGLYSEAEAEEVFLNLYRAFRTPIT